MIKTKMNYNLIETILITVLCNIPSNAQVSIGADIINRYVWRGTDFGDSPSIQPSLEYSIGEITVGTWAAYPFAIGTGVTEHDVYAGYSFGSFKIGVTDYFFPDGADYFDYHSDGNHIIEPYISYAGTVSFLITANVLNDPEYSKYFELSYLKTMENITLNFFIGGSPGQTGWYSTNNGGGLVSVGVDADKDRYGVSYILNPTAEMTYLLFGISF